MNMTFDPVPDDIWEDWKWFVCPEGYILGMNEGAHRLGGSHLALTPCYVFNLPKLIMSDVMWASRLKNAPEGVVDTNDFLQKVNICIDSLIDGLIHILSQYPMVISKRKGIENLTDELGQILEGSNEIILLGGLNEAEQSLSLEDIEVEFRNPFGEDGASHETFIAMIPAESCIRELSIAKGDLSHSQVRILLQGAVEELHRRGMIIVKEGFIDSMTERGRVIIEFEPVKDFLSCRCEVVNINVD